MHTRLGTAPQEEGRGGRGALSGARRSSRCRPGATGSAHPREGERNIPSPGVRGRACVCGVRRGTAAQGRRLPDPHLSKRF